MAVLTGTDLALIRDEVGDDPSDTALRLSFLALGHWMPVAIRVLKRRRATAGAGGGVSSVTITGALAVTLSKADLSSLDAQIARLEAAYDVVLGVPGPDQATSSRLTRLTAR